MRALLTETERGVLGGEADASVNYVRTVRSRVRDRLEELELDVQLLADYEPDLYRRLQRIVERVDE